MSLRVPPSALSLVMLGFDGPSLPDWTAAMLRRGLAGVCLFARNIVDAGQVRDLCRRVREAAAGLPPPLVAVDQEGGRVQRLRRVAPLHPPMREVGAAGADAAREEGRAIGLEVAALGFNLDFAPVLDVDSNPANPIIGDRSFSSDPATVASCGAAFIEGLRSTGVVACGKHFPGHGDASLDSHLDLPVIGVDRDTLLTRELVPFAAAVRSGLGMMMTAHCVYPAIDPALPATLSRAVITGLLRDRLGFEGCVITDDLAMKAIGDRFDPEDVLRLGLDAGVDLFLQCGAGGEGAALAERLERLVADGVVPEARVEASAARVLAIRAAAR